MPRLRYIEDSEKTLCVPETLSALLEVRESPKLTRCLRFYASCFPSWRCPSGRGAGDLKLRLRRPGSHLLKARLKARIRVVRHIRTPPQVPSGRSEPG